MLWLLPVGLLPLLLFKNRISRARYLQRTLSIRGLLASFFITFLNRVKHQWWSLGGRSQRLGKRTMCLPVRNAWPRRCPKRLPPLPAAIPPRSCRHRSSRGAALRQTWERNGFKALVWLFSWAYFTGPLYHAAGQRRKGREDWRATAVSTLECFIPSHGIALPVSCACWKQSHSLQLTGRRRIP